LCWEAVDCGLEDRAQDLHRSTVFSADGARGGLSGAGRVEGPPGEADGGGVFIPQYR
jgi:hypothetical protein